MSQTLPERFPELYFVITEASEFVKTVETKVPKKNRPSFAQILDKIITQHGIQSAGLVGDIAGAAEEYFSEAVVPA